MVNEFRKSGGGGAAGGSGYEFQSLAIAYVACHILAGKPLNWFPDETDVPVGVTTETRGPGDDLRIELFAGRIIEVQAKAGLKKGDDFWNALLKLVNGLKADSQLMCVLLLDHRASATIGKALATEIERLAGGLSSSLSPLGEELLKKSGLDSLRDSHVFQRLRIVELHADPSQPSRSVALSHLQSVLARRGSAADAFEILIARSLRLIRLRGRLGMDVLQRVLLRRDCPLDTSGSSPSALRRRFLEWQAARMSTFGVPSFVRNAFHMDADWIPRSVSARTSKAHDDSKRPPAEPIERLIGDATKEIRVLLAGPGEGKSLVSRRLTYWLAKRGRLVVHVRLRLVARNAAAGMPFAEALWKVATDGQSISKEEWLTLLREPFFLIADGIDECGRNTAETVEGLRDWHLGQQCSMFVTSRPGAVEVPGAASWKAYDLDPLAEADQTRFIEMLVQTIEMPVSAQSSALTIKTTLKKSRFTAFGPPSPLVLAFVTRLTLDGVNAAQRRSDLFDQLARRMIDDPPHDARPEPDLDAPIRRWAYRCAGWHLLVNEPRDQESLEGLMASSAPGAHAVERANIAHRGLAILEARGVLEPAGDGWTFVHDALAEHAAGSWFARDMDSDQQRAWALGNANESRFRQLLLFAAGASASTVLVNAVSEAWNRENAIAYTPIQLAMMLAEMGEPTTALVNSVLPELIARIALPVSEIAEESAEALRALAERIPQPVAMATTQASFPSFTRAAFHALGILLACGDSFVDVDQLRNVLEAAAADKGANVPETFEAVSGTVTLASLFSSTLARRQQTLIQAADYLLRTDRSESAADLVVRLAQGTHITMDTMNRLQEVLTANGHQEASVRIYSGAFGSSFESFFLDFALPRESDLELLRAFRAALGSLGPSRPFSGGWRSMTEFGKLLNCFEWGEQPVGSFNMPLDQFGFVNVVRVTIQAGGLDASKLAGELEWAIVAQTQRLASPKELIFDGIYSSLHKTDPKLRWTNVTATDNDREKIVEALLHPCLAVRVVAINAINGGVLGDKGQMLCRKLADTHGVDASFLAFVDERVLGANYMDLLVGMIPAKIPYAAWPIIAQIASLDQKLLAVRWLDVLVRSVSAPARVAEWAVKALLRYPANDVNQHNEQLWSAFSSWKSRDNTQENRIIPNSPRALMVQLFHRIGSTNTDRLIDLLNDHRSDVRDQAVDFLCVELAASPSSVGSFLLAHRCNANVAFLVNKLGRESPQVLRDASTELLCIASDAHASVRVAAIRQLQMTRPPQDQTAPVLLKACRSEYESIRAAAVSTARALGIAIDKGAFELHG